MHLFKIFRIFSSLFLSSTLISPILANSVSTQKYTKDDSKYHYFFKLPLYSTINKTQPLLIESDRLRLEQYYKKYFQYKSRVNSETSSGIYKFEGEQNPNFYIHIEKSDFLKNREWEWAKIVKLNRLSIDRLYERGPEEQEISIEEYKELLKTENLLPEYTQITKSAINPYAIDIFFKKTRLEKDEINKLVFPPLKSDALKIGPKRWFVWLDKNILQIKLNLGFHIWLFNQPIARNNQYIKDVLEPKKSRKSNWLKQKIQSLYNSLSETEKEFYEFYFQKIWDKKQFIKSKKYLELSPNEITSKDLNKIYNLLVKEDKNLDIFQGHLIQVINGGNKGEFESFFPSYILYSLTASNISNQIIGEDGYRKFAKLTITPNTSINPDLRFNILEDILKNHSIKHFTLRTQSNAKNKWPLNIFALSPESHFPIILENFFVERSSSKW